MKFKIEYVTSGYTTQLAVLYVLNKHSIWECIKELECAEVIDPILDLECYASTYKVAQEWGEKPDREFEL